MEDSFDSYILSQNESNQSQKCYSQESINSYWEIFLRPKTHSEATNPIFYTDSSTL